MGEWQKSSLDHLVETISAFRVEFPGWWFTIGECQVSADASCAPTSESSDIALIPSDGRFDSGFHVDLAQPATMAEALRDVMDDARQALKEARP